MTCVFIYIIVVWCVPHLSVSQRVKSTNLLGNRYCKVVYLTETTYFLSHDFSCAISLASKNMKVEHIRNIILYVSFLHFLDCWRKSATLTDKTVLPSSKTALAGWKSIPFQSVMSQSKYLRISLDFSHGIFIQFHSMISSGVKNLNWKGICQLSLVDL